MRSMAAALAAVLPVSACSAAGGYGTEITSDEFETGYSTVYAETISFSGFENKEYESELNLSVENDVKAAVEEFDSLAQEAAETLPEGVKSALNITQDVKRADSGFVSFVESHYIYAGGAHGNTSWYPRNIDVISSDPHNLTLSELFSDEEYKEKLTLLMEEEIKEDPERYSGLWEQPSVNDETENYFYVTDSDLVIFFSPYTLSYYAKGFVEFDIRLTEIEGMLKDEYKRLVIEGKSQ